MTCDTTPNAPMCRPGPTDHDYYGDQEERWGQGDPLLERLGTYSDPRDPDHHTYNQEQGAVSTGK